MLKSLGRKRIRHTSQKFSFLECNVQGVSCGSNYIDSKFVFGGNEIAQCIGINSLKEILFIKIICSDFCLNNLDCKFWTVTRNVIGLIGDCKVYRSCVEENDQHSVSGERFCQTLPQETSFCCPEKTYCTGKKEK